MPLRKMTYMAIQPRMRTVRLISPNGAFTYLRWPFYGTRDMFFVPDVRKFKMGELLTRQLIKDNQRKGITDQVEEDDGMQGQSRRPKKSAKKEEKLDFTPYNISLSTSTTTVKKEEVIDPVEAARREKERILIQKARERIGLLPKEPKPAPPPPKKPKSK
eukprot:TRINITY_DN17017_c0_g1_i1.p1 TRINITY_DN17017_c0_g1~~TRINITY_DN17017_c0_g1_i1.p1  ORF type:complete len:160 (-),score=48.90 TRINITY_DN17017_c0_g1_i1:62-541(-)